jgi:RecB family exonuclease
VSLQFGKIFHTFAESFFELCDYEKLRQATNAREAYEVFRDLTVENPVVKKWVDNFKRFEANRWETCLYRFPQDPIKYWRPVATELELWIPSTGQLLHIDRISWMDERSLINLDYKTGRADDIKELRPELTFYNIGVNAKDKYRLVDGKKVPFTLPAPCLWIGSYNPTLDIPMCEKVKQISTTCVIKSLWKMRAGIRAGDYPFKPSGLCRWCPRLQGCLDDGIINDGCNYYESNEESNGS